MSTICEMPIVAIVCEDENKEFHVFHLEKPVSYEEVEIKDKTIEVNNLSIITSSYESVIICNETYYNEMREKFQIA